MHYQLIVQLNVHDVAKTVAFIRFRLVSIVGFGDWHLLARCLLNLRLLIQLLLWLVLDGIGARVKDRKGGEARHIWIQIADVAVAYIRSSGSYTWLRRLLTWVSNAELVAVCGPVVDYRQIRAIIRIRLPHRAVADRGWRLNRICIAVAILVKLVVVTTLPAIIVLVGVASDLVHLLLDSLLLLLEILTPLLSLLKLLEKCSSVVAWERVVTIWSIIKCIMIRLRNHRVS